MHCTIKNIRRFNEECYELCCRYENISRYITTVAETSFWDFRYDEMDWRASCLTVMARVFERGNKEEWEEMIRFYGPDQVIHAVKNEIKFLADYAIEKVCVYFSIPKEDMLCYIRKQSRPGHWF